MEEVEEGAQEEGKEEEEDVGSSAKVRRRRGRMRMRMMRMFRAAYATRRTILPAHFCVTLATKPFTCTASSPLWNKFRRVSGIADVVSNGRHVTPPRCKSSWKREVEGVGEEVGCPKPLPLT